MSMFAKTLASGLMAFAIYIKKINQSNSDVYLYIKKKFCLLSFPNSYTPNVANMKNNKKNKSPRFPT